MATSKTTSKTTSAAPAAAMEGLLPSFDDLSKMLQQFKLPGIDVSAIAESQRKDFEALAEANRQAYAGMQALAQRRNEMLKDAFAGMTGPDTLSRQTAQVQQRVQQIVDNFRELAQMEAETRNQAWKVLQDRYQENVANLQALLQPKR